MGKEVNKNIRYPVAEPHFSGNEEKYVRAAMQSGWVSSAGPFISEFEKKFAEFCGARYAFSCCNGTAALHLALLSLGIGPGDEVIVPSLTFIATANAVCFVGAKPVFVDVEPHYWQIDPKKIPQAINKGTKAIIPVHLYGHPAKMDEIAKIARARKLFVIEDAAEALGAYAYKKMVSRWSDVTAFSFYGNKIITTGEGGMVVTDRPALAKKIISFRSHGMVPGKQYVHDTLGRNFRMTNLQAALGLGQLEQAGSFIQKKREIASWYADALKKIPGLILHPEAPWAKNVYWMYSVLIDPAKTGRTRDEVAAHLHKKGIETRPFFHPIHKQPLYAAHSQLSFPHAERIASQGMNLPSSVKLEKRDVGMISAALKHALRAK